MSCSGEKKVICTLFIYMYIYIHTDVFCNQWPTSGMQTRSVMLKEVPRSAPTSGLDSAFDVSDPDALYMFDALRSSGITGETSACRKDAVEAAAVRAVG